MNMVLKIACVDNPNTVLKFEVRIKVQLQLQKIMHHFNAESIRRIITFGENETGCTKQNIVHVMTERLHHVTYKKID
jgi:hypothetical protein